MQAFIDGQISFTDIFKIVSQSVDHLRSAAAKTLRDLEDVSAAEDDARSKAGELVKKGAHR